MGTKKTYTHKSRSVGANQTYYEKTRIEDNSWQRPIFGTLGNGNDYPPIGNIGQKTGRWRKFTHAATGSA